MRGHLIDVEFDAVGDRVLVAIVSGEVDSSNAGDLRLAVSDRLPAVASDLVLDLTAVTYLDSSGVEVVFELARGLAERRQRLGVIAPPASGARRVLELCAVESVARLFDARDDALSALRG